MNYVCRDCGHFLQMTKPTNRCPQCESIYLLPEKFLKEQKPKIIAVKLSERFLSLIFGMFFGLLSFFILGIAILLKGGPGAGKAAAGAFYFAIKFSLVMAVCVGVVGFIWGDEKLAKLLGILWGTDSEFNNKFNDELASLVYAVPQWFVYLLLVVAIIGSYGYLMVRL